MLPHTLLTDVDVCLRRRMSGVSASVSGCHRPKLESAELAELAEHPHMHIITHADVYEDVYLRRRISGISTSVSGCHFPKPESAELTDHRYMH